MQCYIYRSSVKEGLYVYLADKDGLENLPGPLKKQLGEPQLSMSIELTEDRKLNQEDAGTVLKNLADQGYHVQMPKDIEHQLEAIAKHSTLRKQGNQ